MTLAVDDVHELGNLSPRPADPTRKSYPAASSVSVSGPEVPSRAFNSSSFSKLDLEPVDRSMGRFDAAGPRSRRLSRSGNSAAQQKPETNHEYERSFGTMHRSLPVALRNRVEASTSAGTAARLAVHPSHAVTLRLFAPDNKPRPFLRRELFHGASKLDPRHEPHVAAGPPRVDQVALVFGPDTVYVRLAACLVLAQAAGVEAADLGRLVGHSRALVGVRTRIWPCAFCVARKSKNAARSASEMLPP